jgi:RNA polymerase primary sigma factor
MLDAYLGHVARLAPLTAAEEAAATRELVELRRVAWRAVLAEPGGIEAVLDLLPEEARGRATRARDLEEVVDVLVFADARALPRAVARIAPAAAHPLRRALERLAVAHRRFVEANLRLVVSIARRHDHGLVPLADLVQEGNLGLLKAVDRFDPSRGTRFSTFAVWWIRHTITRAMSNHGRTIRIPVHVTVDHLNLRKATRRLEAELARAPSDEEVAQVLDMAVERVGSTRRAMQCRPVSTDAPLHVDGAEKVEDVLACEHADEAWEHVEFRCDAPVLDRALATLPGLERRILDGRFGLDGGEERTLADIGTDHRLSRERIRQLQNRALARLREQLDACDPAA